MASEELNQFYAQLPGAFLAPSYWMEFYELLPDGANGKRPPVPLVLGAVGEPSHAKAARFREQLNWAWENEGLPMVAAYLMCVPETAWES